MIYDSIIIGKGPAGISAAIYLKRYGYNPLVIGKDGGALEKAHLIENYYGIDMEIAKLLADHLGMELVIKDMEFDAVCLSVGQHKCDIAMAGLTVNEERTEHVTFSTSYYTANQKIIVKGDDTTFDACKTAEDVEKILKSYDATTKIGVQNGTTGNWYVAGDEDWGFDGFKTKCVGYGSGALAVQDLINGNINYVVIDSDPAKFITDAINAVA